MKQQLTIQPEQKEQLQNPPSSSPLQSSPVEQAMVHPVLRLQRVVGNQAVQRMVREGELGSARSSETETAPGIVHDVLRSQGQPLDTRTRAIMEPRFGQDFSQVRVHTNAQAKESTRAVNALAYTVGRDVVFGEGQYMPQTNEGKQLLAHELTHVVQQRGRDNRGPTVVGPVDDSYEREAGMMSAAITSNESPTVNGGAGATNRVQRVSRNASLNPNLIATHTATEAFPGSGNGLLLQRVTLGERVAELEKHSKAQDKHQQATDLDLRWGKEFEILLSSYRQAIYRISGGLNEATKNFQSAQKKQAETDALAWLVIGAMVTLAGGFEWAFVPALGKLGMEAEAAEHTISVVHAGVDIAVDVAKESKGDKETPEVPSIPGAKAPAGAAGGDPLAFLSKNLEAIEAHNQNITEAFKKRLDDTRNYSDDQWMQFDLGGQENQYQNLYNELKKVASGVEQLKPAEQLAHVLERHLWARWISKQAEELGRQARYMPAYKEDIRSPEERQAEAEKNYTLGSDIEDRLNQLEFLQPLGIKLSGHWWWPNSPGNWKELLLTWARGYSESITAAKGSPD